ncbi:hypothetical protein J2T60_002574 [Natronospira proteinivora]|uniref:Uncharacterized protein n=1 Tax=Natronospira proteinivora TaxID=1807133 RepID=A0ABT1GCB4_9GAMM|nr:hypothetical protein [Natronospira proteinivora]
MPQPNHSLNSQHTQAVTTVHSLCAHSMHQPLNTCVYLSRLGDI